MLAETVPAVLKIEEAAELLRISRNRCYALVREGTLPVLPGVKPLRIARAAVERLLAVAS